MFDAIVAQRNSLVDRLDGLTAEQWETPSLCAGWRVREVVGHLISILEIPFRQHLWGAVKERNFNRNMDKLARSIGEREPGTLIADYRRLCSTRFAPPIVGPIAPLTDVLVHTRDIERPLGIASTLDAEATRAALVYVCGGKAFGFVPPKRTRGLQFEATDLGWSAGAGKTVVGSGEAILMSVTGRRSALDDLTGDGVAALRSPGHR